MNTILPCYQHNPLLPTIGPFDSPFFANRIYHPCVITNEMVICIVRSNFSQAFMTSKWSYILVIGRDPKPYPSPKCHDSSLGFQQGTPYNNQTQQIHMTKLCSNGFLTLPSYQTRCCHHFKLHRILVLSFQSVPPQYTLPQHHQMVKNN